MAAVAQFTMNMSNIIQVSQKISKARTVSKITCERVEKRHEDITTLLEGMIERTYMPQQQQFRAHDKNIARAASGNDSQIVTGEMLQMFLLLKETIANEKRITGNVAKAVASAVAIKDYMTKTELEYMRTLSCIKNVTNQMTSAKRNYFLSHQTLLGNNKNIPEDQLYEMDITVIQLDEGEKDEDVFMVEDEDNVPLEEGAKKQKKPAHLAKNANMRRIHSSSHSQFTSGKASDEVPSTAQVDYGIFFHKKYNNNMQRIYGIIRRDGFGAMTVEDKKMLLHWFVLCRNNIDTKITNCRAHIAAMRAKYAQFNKLTIEFHAQLDELEKQADYQHRVHLIDS